MFLAQSVFPCAVVGQKDCATTAFRCRFAAAACCHGRSFPLYRRNLERISPFRHAAPVRACHSEPVLTLAWQSVPRARRRGNPFFTCCLRRGTFVSSDKSTQKRRLKLRFKTSSARYSLPQICLVFLAQSLFLRTAVRQKDCATTAFRCRFADAACCHGRIFPSTAVTGREL